MHSSGLEGVPFVLNPKIDAETKPILQVKNCFVYKLIRNY